MSTMISRRALLASASAIAASPLIAQRVHAQPASALRLVAERRTLDIAGKAASVFAIRPPNGMPGVTLDPGQRFVVDLENRTDQPTIIHWHGQTPPVRQDGVADTGLEPLIVPGASQAYDFEPRAGTYWMHSHHGLQEQLLMAAPLIVRTADDVRADAQELVVPLHDFTFRNPDEILAELTKGTGMTIGPGQMAGMDMRGGSMPGMDMEHGHGPGMNMASHSTADMKTDQGSMPGMSMGHTPMSTSSGAGAAKSGTAMDLNDIDFDAYLANDRTLDDPFVLRTERSGRVRLRLINGATSTAFWIDLGALDGTIVAVDGDPVQPLAVKRFPMTEAQRVDVIVQLPKDDGAFPVLAQREGDLRRTGIILASPGAVVVKLSGTDAEPAPPVDLSLERRLRALHPLELRNPDVVHRVALTGMMSPYSWGIDSRSWTEHRPLTVSKGQRVELDIVNQTQMAHPMHLHGHRFQVVALNGQRIAGALRDTVLVPINGTVRIAFDADNPGRWLFHCHNLYHMAAGMMTEVAYSGFI